MDLTQIVNAINNLGEGAFSAFIVWVICCYGSRVLLTLFGLTLGYKAVKAILNIIRIHMAGERLKNAAGV